MRIIFYPLVKTYFFFSYREEVDALLYLKHMIGY